MRRSMLSGALRAGPVAVCLALAVQPTHALASEAPATAAVEAAADDIVALVVQAMGGPESGRVALEAAGAWSFRFTQRVRRQADGSWILASHHYQKAGDGRLRLDVRILEGEGADSVTIVSGEEAWVRTEDGLQDVDAAATRERLRDFSPLHLFDIPLGLPVAPEEFLRGQPIEVRSGEATEEGRAVLALRGEVDQEGEVVMEVDAETYRLLGVSFDSRAGRIHYRYGDYGDAADALVLPRHRRLSRNETLLSVVQVESLQLGWQPEADTFDPELASLQASEGGE